MQAARNAAPTAARNRGAAGTQARGSAFRQREVAARVKARQPAVDLGEQRRHVDVAVGVAHDPGNRAHRREAVVEHAHPQGPLGQPAALSWPGGGADWAAMSAP